MEKMPDDPALAISIINVRAGFSAPIVELGKLARRGYHFIGGIEVKANHKPEYRQSHLDLSIGEWIYNIEKGAERTTTVTNIGGIAILSGLFGNLDVREERLILGKRLTNNPPPYFAHKEVPTLQEHLPPEFKFYVRPELITKAQLYPDDVTGNVHVVKPVPGQLEPIGQGLYNSFADLQTLGVLPLNGKDLFNIEVEPDSFDDVQRPYGEPRK